MAFLKTVDYGNTYIEYQCPACEQKFAIDMEDPLDLNVCPECGAREVVDPTIEINDQPISLIELAKYYCEMENQGGLDWGETDTHWIGEGRALEHPATFKIKKL